MPLQIGSTYVPLPQEDGEICEYCWMQRALIHGLQGKSFCHYEQMEVAARNRLEAIVRRA